MYIQCYTYTCIVPQEPGYEAGDIIIVLDEQEHPIFTRKGSDLLLNMVRVNECDIRRVHVQ